jgi:uncharacterized membrane protein
MMQWLSMVMTMNIGLALVCLGLLARTNECQKTLEQTFFGIGYMILFVTCVMFCVAALCAILTWRRLRSRRLS